MSDTTTHERLAAWLDGEAALYRERAQWAEDAQEWDLAVRYEGAADALVQLRDRVLRGLAAIFGQWPGDETEAREYRRPAALLRTPRGEGPVVHIPDDAEYRDDGSVHWRVRLPAGTPSGEGEAMDADEMWNHWTSGHEDAALQGLRTATDDEAHRFLGMVADWQRCPKPSDHDAIAALRSEAGGEEGGGVPAHVYVVTANDDERVAEQKVFANRQDAQREYERLVDLYGGSAVCLASRYVRAARRGEGGGE